MTKKRVLSALVLVVAILLLGAVFVCYRHPLAVFAWFERASLRQNDFTKSSIETPSGPLVVWEKGNGPVLVLLHGAGDQAGAWSRIAPHLVSSYRVLIPDLPGHGDSAPAQGGLTLGMELAGLQSLLNARAAGERVILVGNSMGGWIAMVYAYRHPEQVARIVLVNGGALRPEHPLNLTPATREEAKHLLASLQDPAMPLPPDFVVDDVIRTASAGPIGRLSRNAADMEQYLLDGHLQDAKTPTDVLWGEADRMLGISYAHRLEAELPAARLTLLSRCGHAPTRECPIAFTAKLKDILKQAPPQLRTVTQSNSQPASGTGK
jgi:pimeloyl-ACP methyl ester carboxylesterase